jgi:hypothetical protein
MEIDTDDTVLELKQRIYTLDKTLSSNCMKLNYAGINMENTKKVKDYKMKNGSKLIQAKSDLSLIPGLIISYEPDCLYLDDHKEARAKMPCGHVISRDSMTALL